MTADFAHGLARALVRHGIGEGIQSVIAQHVVQLLQRHQQQPHVDAGARGHVDVARFQAERVWANGDPAFGSDGQILAHGVPDLRRLRVPVPPAGLCHVIASAPIHERQGLPHVPPDAAGRQAPVQLVGEYGQRDVGQAVLSDDMDRKLARAATDRAQRAGALR